MKVIVNLHAEQDLEAAEDYYNSEKPGLGLEFLLEFFDAVEEIKNNPEVWKETDNQTRRYLMSRFPFQVVYINHEKLIEIIAVAHFKRKFKYWKR